MLKCWFPPVSSGLNQSLLQSVLAGFRPTIALYSTSTRWFRSRFSDFSVAMKPVSVPVFHFGGGKPRLYRTRKH